MKIVVSHETDMAQRAGLLNPKGSFTAPGTGARSWINAGLTQQEQNNLALVQRFWEAWRAQPFDMEALRSCFHPNVTVRTGWRGEHVVYGREEALDMYAEEIQRQADNGEVIDFRLPILIANGPVVFHTWVWIASSERLGYHIERPMAAFYLITDGQIERWDDYCTGPQSEPGYAAGSGPDGR